MFDINKSVKNITSLEDNHSMKRVANCLIASDFKKSKMLVYFCCECSAFMFLGLVFSSSGFLLVLSK